MNTLKAIGICLLVYVGLIGVIKVSGMEYTIRFDDRVSEICRSQHYVGFCR